VIDRLLLVLVVVVVVLGIDNPLEFDCTHLLETLLYSNEIKFDLEIKM
jgi:hypothetical protein